MDIYFKLVANNTTVIAVNQTLNGDNTVKSTTVTQNVAGTSSTIPTSDWSFGTDAHWVSSLFGMYNKQLMPPSIMNASTAFIYLVYSTNEGFQIGIRNTGSSASTTNTIHLRVDTVYFHQDYVYTPNP